MMPISIWNTFTPDITWGTADPASVTSAGIYTVVEGICFFALYASSADSNACTTPSIALPVDPAQTCDIACMGYQLNNATHVQPGAYINADQAAAADRVVTFTGFTACTDAAAVAVYVSGFFPVAA
jgi:hypothetical protein